MADFTSSLYLGLRHPSDALPGWTALTTGATSGARRPAGCRRGGGAARGAGRGPAGDARPLDTARVGRRRGGSRPSGRRADRGRRCLPGRPVGRAAGRRGRRRGAAGSPPRRRGDGRGGRPDAPTRPATGRPRRRAVHRLRPLLPARGRLPRRWTATEAGSCSTTPRHSACSARTRDRPIRTGTAVVGRSGTPAIRTTGWSPCRRWPRRSARRSRVLRARPKSSPRCGRPAAPSTPDLPRPPTSPRPMPRSRSAPGAGTRCGPAWRGASVRSGPSRRPAVWRSSEARSRCRAHPPSALTPGGGCWTVSPRAGCRRCCAGRAEDVAAVTLVVTVAHRRSEVEHAARLLGACWARLDGSVRHAR